MRRHTRLAAALVALAGLTVSGATIAEGATSRTSGNAASDISSERVAWNNGTTQKNKRIMKHFTSEFLPTGDAELAKKFLSPNIVMYFGGPPMQGRDTYLGVVAANFEAFPDLKWTVEDMRAEGNTVAIRYSMTGTHEGTFAGVPATGKKISAQAMAFYRLANGKIVEERAQLDMLSILEQMDAIPSA